MQFSNNNFCSIKLKWAVRTAVLDGIGIVVNPNFMWLLQCCTSRGWVFDAHSPRSFAIIPMQWHTRFEYDGQWWRCGLALSSTTTLTQWKWVYFCRPIFHQNHPDKHEWYNKMASKPDKLPIDRSKLCSVFTISFAIHKYMSLNAPGQTINTDADRQRRAQAVAVDCVCSNEIHTYTLYSLRGWPS